MPPWIEYLACVVCAISGVLAAEGKQIDLFGALVLALVTAVGGGTIRDICLDSQVFWLKDPGTLLSATLAAVFTFLAVRFMTMPNRALLVADAFGLALFGIVGTEKALLLGASPVSAVLLGIVTGVAGGVLRDVLRGEIPWVFRAEIHLYATAVFCGAVVFVLLQKGFPHRESNRYVGMLVILILRLLAMRFGLRLPVFRMRRP
ncbi:MAG: trimeric intracellular cation channel family protein [Verrucomicrobiales bacterium]